MDGLDERRSGRNWSIGKGNMREGEKKELQKVKAIWNVFELSSQLPCNHLEIR